MRDVGGVHPRHAHGVHRSVAILDALPLRALHIGSEQTVERFVVHHGSVHRGRADRVDRDAVHGDFQRERFHQPDHAPFAGHVMRQVRNAGPSRARGDRHNAATAPFDHVRSHGSQRLEDSAQIGVDNCVPHLVAEFPRLPERAHCRVGDADIDLSEHVDRRCNCGIDGRGIAHVDDGALASATKLADQSPGLVQLVFGPQCVGHGLDVRAHIDSEDVGAFCGQGQCVRTALTTRRSGDERGLALEFSHVAIPTEEEGRPNGWRRGRHSSGPGRC